MKTIGWGLIGIGKLADIAIAPAINREDDSTIAAVCSRDLQRARDFGERHAAGASYDDYGAMLADDAVDVVYIATPNGMHAEHVLSAVAAGKHVLVEKPMALSLEDGRDMVRAADGAGLLLAVGFHLRHKENNVRARDMILSGELGELIYVDASIGAGQSLYPYDTWRADPAMAGGGTLLHQGTHVIDLVGFLTGRPVVAVTSQMTGSPEDVFVGTCQLDGGALATVSSHHMYAGTRPDWVVAGTDGWLECRGGTFPTAGDVLTLHAGSDATPLATGETSAYRLEVRAFNEAVAGRAPVSGTGVDGLRNIAVVEALYRAQRDRSTAPVAAAIDP